MSGIGDVLETLRRARGLTQQDLCAKVGLTQAALSRYESDLRLPDDDVLAKLASALGVTAHFLARGQRVSGALAVDAHMRRQRTAKASAWRTLEARLNEHRLHSSLLFEEVSIRAEQSVPTFDPVDTPPSEAALMVRAQWRMPAGPVRHLVRWLEAAGCLVFEEDFGTQRVDGLSQWIEDHPVFLINSSSPTDRKRLTLAHELGHVVLHNGVATEQPESEAAEFAAEFLMPGHVIRPDLRPVTVGHLRELKHVWGTSMQALVERARDLGVVSESDRTRFYQTLNARGWKVKEPGGEMLAGETPELVVKIGQTLQEKGLSDEEIASIAGFAAGVANNPFLPPHRHLQAV